MTNKKKSDRNYPDATTGLIVPAEKLICLPLLIPDRIMRHMKIKKPAFNKENTSKVLLVLIVIIIFFLWINYAPPGLLGKMDAVGYAVCHRIEVRSFHLGDRAIPLCARCSGMHLATLMGLLFQLQWSRRGGMPPKKIMVILGLFAAAFAIDGLNSYLHFFPNAPSLYEPNNILRLITGTGLGLGISAVLYPVFNQTVWVDWQDEPVIGSWKSIGILLFLAALLDLAILSENPLVLYPLAVVSGLAVLTTLTICYTLILVLFFKKDNMYRSWRSLWFPLLAGFGIALLQTYVIDILRYTWTGTWGGFIL